jgi:hypothetical protein
MSRPRVSLIVAGTPLRRSVSAKASIARGDEPVKPPGLSPG